MVDDGSTDNTQEVATRYSDPRICTLYQENQGLSAARNTGIKAARGRYLTFLDADDEWEPDFLAVGMSILRQKPDAVGVYTRFAYIDLYGRRLPTIGGFIVPAREFAQRIRRHNFFTSNAALVCRQAVINAGLFDTTLTSYEDWDLWIRLAGKGEMYGHPEPLARYRVYGGSMSTHVARMHDNRLRILSKHFGDPTGNPQTWTEEKRDVYALAFLNAAVGYLHNGALKDGWYFLEQGIAMRPEMLKEVQTYYELLCSTQDRGVRGRADLLDIEANAAFVFEWLDGFLTREAADYPADLWCKPAYVTLYLTLTMLTDEAGEWQLARRYLWSAVKIDPQLLRSTAVLRRWGKLWAGKRLASGARLLAADVNRMLAFDSKDHNSHAPG